MHSKHIKTDYIVRIGYLGVVDVECKLQNIYFLFLF